MLDVGLGEPEVTSEEVFGTERSQRSFVLNKSVHRSGEQGVVEIGVAFGVGLFKLLQTRIEAIDLIGRMESKTPFVLLPEPLAFFENLLLAVHSALPSVNKRLLHRSSTDK